MIFSGKTIKEWYQNDTSRITPNPIPEQFQPASLDVRLGHNLYDVDIDDTRHIPPENADDEEFVIYPEIPYISHTLDDIDLNDDVAAMLTGRSSIGRAGIIVHKTAGWIDPGFSGQITLEMYNFGPEPVRLKPGQRVAQLVMFEVDRKTEGYDGSYQDQVGIRKSALEVENGQTTQR